MCACLKIGYYSVALASVEPTEILFLSPEYWDSRLYASTSSIDFIFIMWTRVYYACMPIFCVYVPLELYVVVDG